MERNIALKLMYNGTAYHGWQVQKNAISVAETLEKSLETVVGHRVKCTGAGRTDAGVHAETYVANFRTTSAIPCDRLPLAVNTRLPNDIVVVKATHVPDSFNAIGSCQRKEYTYPASARSTPTGSTIPAWAIPSMWTEPGSTPSAWMKL